MIFENSENREKSSFIFQASLILFNTSLKARIANVGVLFLMIRFNRLIYKLYEFWIAALFMNIYVFFVYYYF